MSQSAAKYLCSLLSYLWNVTILDAHIRYWLSVLGAWHARFFCADTADLASLSI